MPDSTPDDPRLDRDAWLTIHRRVEEFEVAWQRGEPMPIEQAIAGLNGAARAECLGHALAVELEYRRRNGETPLREEYLARIPESETVIRKAFADLDAPPTVDRVETSEPGSDSGVTALFE